MPHEILQDAAPPGFTPAVFGIVTGMTAEARLVRGLGWVATGGGTPEGALRAAERLIAAGASALLSFGLAGGLDPALRAGDLLVPVSIIDTGETFSTDTALRTLLGAGASAPILAETQIIAGAGYKAMLSRQTGACAVDLESGVVARVAARHGRPFAALRVICDPAERTLTPAALVGLAADGGVAILSVLGALLRQPGELPALLALARDAAAARASLVRRVDQIRLRGGLVL